MKTRRVLFWVGVGGVAILSNFLLELGADHIPLPAVQRLAAYIHRGPGGA